MKAQAQARKLRKRSRQKERGRARFWGEKLGARPQPVSKQDKRGQILGLPEDPNLKTNGALQYFSKVIGFFKDRLPKEVFP